MNNNVVEITLRDGDILKKNCNVVINNNKVEVIVENEKKKVNAYCGKSLIFMQGRILKSNKIIINLEKDKKYKLIWMDNFFYFGCCLFLLFIFMLINMKIYALNTNISIFIQIVIFLIISLVIPIFWNDLIIIGRKIKIIEIVDDEIFEEI